MLLTGGLHTQGGKAARRAGRGYRGSVETSPQAARRGPINAPTAMTTKPAIASQ